MGNHKSLKDLEGEWNQRLRDEGFIDIESSRSKDRQLKEWHNLKFTSERSRVLQASRSQYQREIDEITNHPCFPEACKSVVSDLRCKFSIEDIELIWDLHSQGYSRRQIASRLNKVKSRIDDAIKRLYSWIRLV